MKNLELANKVISYSENGIEATIQLIENHIEQDELIDYVDGLTVSENFEFTFTCKEFLEFISDSEEKNNYRAIQEAKQLLKDNGYYTDSLWCIDDVKGKFNCTDDEAYDVLEGALTNDATMEQIWLAIDIHGEADELERNEDNENFPDED